MLALAIVPTALADDEPPEVDSPEAPAFSDQPAEEPGAPAAVDSSDPDASNDGLVPEGGSCPPPPGDESFVAPASGLVPGSDPPICLDGSAPLNGVNWSANTSAFRFNNADGYWTIYKRCFDRTYTTFIDGATRTVRRNVGPGYIARWSRTADGPLLVDNYIERWRDAHTPGLVNAVHGGLGTFGWHQARGPVGGTLAGDDPTTGPNEYSSQSDRERIDGYRRPGVVEGRMCAHPGQSESNGVYARSWAGPTRVSSTRVDLTMDIWLRDQYGSTGHGPDFPGGDGIGDAIARVRYRYSFLRSSVRVWIAVTTYATVNQGGTPVVKEPKFTALVRGGNYTRMSTFKGEGGSTFHGGNTSGASNCLGQIPCVLQTEHTAENTRVRVRWDYGTAAGSEGTEPCSEPATPNPIPNRCFNVVMRGYPVDGTNVLRPASATSWVGSANWEGGGLGPDRWAALSDGRSKAYPRDTAGDDVVSYCGVARQTRHDLNGDGSYSDSERSRASEEATTAADGVRRWEHGGWKSGGSYTDALTLFHGWEDGRGPYDCEPLQRAFGAVGETWGVHAVYSAGAGWESS